MRFNFRKETLIHCAEASKAAYDVRDRILVYERAEHYIIAFKGSASLEDWVEDTKFEKVSLTPIVDVHLGFWTEWMKCRAEFAAIVSMLPNKPVYLTGHSLGGALATIACQQHTQYNLPLITFASPKAGNKGFVDFLNKNNDVLTQRVVLDNDPIASNPAWANYKHIDGKLHLNKNGRIINNKDTFIGTIRDTLNFISYIREHSIDGYVKATQWYARDTTSI